MNIKQIVLTIVFIATSLGIFFSCDKIEEPYLKPVYTDRFVLTELISDAQSLDASLYSDFNQLGEGNNAVIRMVVLSGDNSIEGNSIAAKQIVSKFNLNTANPSAMINRSKATGNYEIEKNKWETSLETALEENGDYVLDVNEVDINSTKKLTSYIQINVLNQPQNPLNLTCYILEDSLLVNGIITKHVLRNSTDILTNEQVGRGQIVDLSFDYELSSYQNINNLTALFVLSDASTNEVLQVNATDLSYNDNEDEPGYTPTFSKVQRTLIEDFTGQHCTYCPKAHEEITRLEGVFGDKVIAMAIHYGWQADTDADYPVDYKTTVGTTIGDYFADQSDPLPFGFVNRVKHGSAYKLDYTAWDGEVNRITHLTAKADIDIDAKIENTSLKASVYVKAFEQLDTLVKIQGFIIENHLISKQKFYEAPWEIEDYEQNHVLRASINGLWGEDLTNSPFNAEQIVKKDFTFALSNEWNPDNLALIIIIYNDITKEIIQVQEKEL